MTFGHTEILRIKQTGNLIRNTTLRSSNTFGAIWWTDGKLEAPMRPDSPWLNRNPETKETFWIDECEEVGKEEVGKESQYSNLPYTEAATEQDLINLLKTESLNPDKERYIRTRLWWIWNDPIRNDESLQVRPKDFNDNLYKLIALVGIENNDSRLMTAEAYRELGEHEKAQDLLARKFPDDFHKAVQAITKANLEKNTKPIKM